MEKRFLVVAISENANSFGLRGVVLVAKDGESYQCGSNDINLPELGDYVSMKKCGNSYNFALRGWEIPEKLNDCPKSLVTQMYQKYGML